MRESLDEPVSVVMYYSASKRHVQPHQLHWQGQDYKLGKVDFWHKTRKGDVLIHHFSIGDTGGTAYFKLALDTATLHWTIEEYMTADQLEVTYERHEA
jgi:hypothetical protein